MIALVSTQIIWPTLAPKAQGPPPLAALPSTVPALIGEQHRLPEEQAEAAAASGTFLPIYSAAEKPSASHRGRSRKRARTLKCRSRSLLKKRLPDSLQTSP